MIWSLFLIIAMSTQYHVSHLDDYETMEECFAAREEIVTAQGSPYQNNYQLVCVTKPVTKVSVPVPRPRPDFG